MEIKTDALVSMQVSMSNAGDAGREHTVSADVTVSDGMPENINNGQVCRVDGTQVASFNAGRYTPLNVNFSTTEISVEEHAGIFSAIQAFIAAADGEAARLSQNCVEI